MTKKSHKVLITISIIILLIGEVVCIFVVLPNGCDSVLDFMFGAKYDEADDSLYVYGRDCDTLEFSNKIQIHICFDEYDEVILCDSTELTADDEFFYGGYTIL